MSKRVDFTGWHYGQLDRSVFTDPEITLLQIRIMGVMSTDMPGFQHTPERIAERIHSGPKEVRTALKKLASRGFVINLPGTKGGGRGADWRLLWPKIDPDDPEEVAKALAPLTLKELSGKRDDEEEEEDYSEGRRGSDPGSETPGVRPRVVDPGSETTGVSPPPSSSGESLNEVAQPSSSDESLTLSKARGRRSAASSSARKPTVHARVGTDPWTMPNDHDANPALDIYRRHLDDLGHPATSKDTVLLTYEVIQYAEAHGDLAARLMVEHLRKTCAQPWNPNAVSTFFARDTSGQRIARRQEHEVQVEKTATLAGMRDRLAQRR